MVKQDGFSDFYTGPFRYRGPIIFRSLFHIGLRPQLTVFPESKSDMPLFHWFLAMKVREKIYMSCTKISRYRQLNAWRMKITTCTGNFFLQNNIFSNGSKHQKIARIRKQTEYNQRKLTVISNYVH